MRHQSLPKGLSFTLKPIEKEVGQPGWSNFLRPIDQSMPQHSFQCECLMCKAYQHKKFKQALDVQTNSINNKIRSRVSTSNSLRQQLTDNNYHWIIKHLMVPTHKIATTSLKIHISETLFFKDGEASEFYLSKELTDPTIKKVGKQKLTNAYIQKVMSDRRRKYKDYVRLKTGRKKAEPKKKPLFGQKQVKKQIKDAILIRYIDGYQQLLTENEFLSMFLRRKQDPIWRQIMSIRNFINITNPEQKKSSYIVIKYKKDKIQYEQLFSRAKQLIKIYNEYITPQQPSYISEKQEQQFSQTLQSENLQTYCQYLTYQIIHYIQYFYDEQINNLVIGFFVDQIGHVFLNQVYKLNTKSLLKFQWTNQIYRKRMDQEEVKILETKVKGEIGDAQVGADGIVQVMHAAYQHMRNKFGLDAQDKDDQEEVANNNFYKILHPDFKYNISDVLKDPKLTLSDFKKKYLGHKNQKKPVIKQFTSNMIKTIHLTSPRLRRSVPHEFIQSPTKLNHSTLPSSSRKNESIELTPLKAHTLRQEYQTLPLLSANH